MARLAKISIDLGMVGDAVQLHHLLMDRLDFPGWYGCNWDAFWDAITGLVEMPEVLELKGWNAFSSRLPHDARLMRGCLEEMADKVPLSAPNVIYA